ncbi:DNA adenine methylase [Lutibacter sp. B1]|uniref:DNA adenine methylase n=1 Tax=Lutibacter sp. B1 TaxID=2725996 RepID=UPI001456CC09|nr:DNA adenine methylase [Lutibacter sp. B1]NLP58490.1 DNA adenine methylase [Lutibacter sp. B1]
MIKSPLRYPGGKSRALKIISPIIPEFKEFREPFVGGGSVFVYLKQKYPNRTYWINDLYSNLYHFWKQTQENLDELIEQVYNWRNDFKNGKELHRYLLDNIDTFDELKKASAFFVFNRITFSGTTESGGFSKAAFEKRFTISSIDRVKLLSSILDDTSITNYDYQKVIEKEGENVFIFLDPPYHSATKSALYGKNGNMHKTFDHERFAHVLKNTNHKWLITYDDSKYIKDLFSFANINEWNLTYGMRNVNKNSNQNGKELFISNYELFENEAKFERTLFDEVKEILPKTKSIPNAGYCKKSEIYTSK